MNNIETGSIYIEGTDLSGKDVVGEVIRGKYGISNIQKLSLHSNNPWDADRTGELPSGHPLFPAFLIRSVIWDIQEYRPETEKDHLQISFTAARSAAWTQASGAELKDVFSELLKYSPLFKNSFLLSASVEVKRARLAQRAAAGGAASSIDSMVFTKPDFVEQMDSRLKEIVTKEMGGISIDTSNLTISQVGEILVATIEEEKVQIRDGNTRIAQLDITPELKRLKTELLNYSRKIVSKYALPEEYYDKLENSL